MSHSVTFVLLDAPEEGDTVDEDEIAKLMAPFDEDRTVPLYRVRCYCVGNKAEAAAYEIANAAHGSIASLRESFRSLRTQFVVKDPSNPTDGELAASERVAEENNRRWEAHSAPYFATKDAALAADPDKDAADPTCTDCSGTGQRETNYNPHSKWDWYSIGGRWSGLFRSGYDPAKDPANQGPCDICGATGRRDDDLGREARKADPSYTCNGCGGTGIRTKWPTQWVDAGGNYATTEELAGRIRAGEKGLIPFAILTPKMEWLEKGKMGWFGMAMNEQPNDTWEEQVLAALDRHPDMVAVVVDCHI